MNDFGRIEPERSGRLPLVSVVAPAYNEAAILQPHLVQLYEYLDTLSRRYVFEVLLIDDGSTDGTAQIAEQLARRYDNLVVVHHPRNLGLGQALKTGFAHSRGDYVVTIDLDLSYAPEHIGRLLERLETTRAPLVLASPHMPGGRVSSVPWLRRMLSVWANRFLSRLAARNVSTLTGMVRGYDGDYIRALNLRANDMAILPETIYKTMLLRHPIEEVPGHLDWGLQVKAGSQRVSSMRILRHSMGTLLSGFLFHPFVFFVLPGLALLAFALWVNTWMIVHFFEAWFALAGADVPDRISAAVSAAYQQYPHTFIVGLLSLMLAIQLISLGILALQSKTYFEEIFHLGSVMREAELESSRSLQEHTESPSGRGLRRASGAGHDS